MESKPEVNLDPTLPALIMVGISGQIRVGDRKFQLQAVDRGDPDEKGVYLPSAKFIEVTEDGKDAETITLKGQPLIPLTYKGVTSPVRDIILRVEANGQADPEKSNLPMTKEELKLLRNSSGPR